MASIQFSLIGPPEIYHPATPTPTTDSDVDLVVSDFKNIDFQFHPNPPMGFTENGSLTFLSTGNPCLDFFFHVVPDTPPETLIQRLELAWKHDPLKTLKLLCNLRGVRGTGKSDKEGGYTAALWLHKNHPKTLASNVSSFADFGYSKDLLEILFRLLEGPDARKLAVEEYENWKEKQKTVEIAKKVREKKKLGKKQVREIRKKKEEERKKNGVRYGGRPGGGRVMRIGCVSLADQFKKFNSQPKMSHEEKRLKRAKKAFDRFNNDPDFKFLHERVSDYFAERLRSDMKILLVESEGGESKKKISLAAKWCPSLDSSYDQFTLLCETIAKKVFPRGEYPEYQGIEEAHYAYRVRDRLRKQVLVPLRKALELPEIYMGANAWGSIPYSRVASVAMKTLQGKFLEHDEERFVGYLEQVSMGEAKIAAGALLPHEIVKSLKNYGGKVAELQWKRMVDDMAKKGKLNNCLAICDVSGSMSGIPMEVSVALGVLVSELSDEPWRGKLITFSEEPELQTVVGNSLKEKTKFVRRMEWGGNTDFQKVFDLLLQVAVDGQLKPEQMIKRLFVFSDMEFDDASGMSHYVYNDGGFVNKNQNENQWETDYQVIVRKFREKGYGECVPEIVFWNLRDSEATPVPGKQPGVALVSGFSKNLMTLFLEEGGNLDPAVAVMEDAAAEETVVAASGMDPEAVMEAAISGEEYHKLLVLD